MRRIAVVGGGMAGLAAAWALTDPRHGGDVEVTVYQRGWRLGGKAASSRGVHGRIEEHGLHVWLGYYDNSFALLQQVYAELDRARTDPCCPIPTWRDALAPAGMVGVEDRAGEGATNWLARFRSNAHEPGSAEVDAPPLAVASIVQRGLGLLVDFAASLEHRDEELPALILSGSPRRPRASAAMRLPALLRQVQVATMVGIGESVRMLGEALARAPQLPGGVFLDVLDQAGTELRRHLYGDRADRRTAQLAELVIACLRGIVADGLLADRAGFAAIDHLDLREWLTMHGATAEALASPLVTGLYDLVFGYAGGDSSRPRFAAGLGLFLAGKMFFEYRGSIFWQLRAGMGDAVIAPLYQALRRRGVRFAFFHRLDRLHLDRTGTRIGALTFGRQASTRGGSEYEPLIRVGDLPCFPDRPLAEQLIAEVPADLESHWADRAAEQRVRLETGRDFDDVVLAVSAGMLPHVCGELIDRSPRWRRMVEGLATVPTQALQLWLRPAERSLGWPHSGATVSGYTTPFDTYASMSHLVERESWPATDRPHTIGYFCSVLSAGAAGDDPSAARAAVRANAVEFLEQRIGRIWPAAVTADGFRWSLLCGSGDATDSAALDSQYWTANVDPSDRYVQSLPGTGAVRLAADRSGFANLFLAGDWIDSGLNAGCVEAAVMAGLQAANGVRGLPARSGIRGSWCAPNPT